MIPKLSNVQGATQWLKEHCNSHLCVDSRRVKPGDAFIAWPGYAHDGRRFVKDAFDQGASVCLVEDEGALGYSAEFKELLSRADLKRGGASRSIATYSGLKEAGGLIADAYYEHPSSAMTLIAITGTNGKTSTAWWLSATLAELGRRCAVIGTLGVGEVSRGSNSKSSEDGFTSTGLTTPDPFTLHRSLKEFKDSKIDYCALEASSIGIVEHRLDGAHIETAVFTNLSRDHLDYHLSMQEYFKAKSVLFHWPGLKRAVINADDPKGLELIETLSTQEGSKLQILAFGCRSSQKESSPTNAHAYLFAFDVIQKGALGGLSFKVDYKGTAKESVFGEVNTKIIGDYNVSNLLAVIGVLLLQGNEFEHILRACSNLEPVPGRMQRLNIYQVGSYPTVVVDYAHTPDALEKALQSLQALKTTGASLFCLVGCGGDRDSGKRPLMAQVACENADVVVFTSDNPRGEPAQAIIDQMIGGLGKDWRVKIELDRKTAIRWAVEHAKPNDIVLIAGKGHENYQEIGVQRIPFSDAKVGEMALMEFHGLRSLKSTKPLHSLEKIMDGQVRGEQISGDPR